MRNQNPRAHPVPKAPPDAPDSRQLVKRFCDSVFWLKLVHSIYTELFEDDTGVRLMGRTAAHFFHDLNRILIDYFLLEAAKLTDPATSRGGTLQNFTVANLLETIEWPPTILAEAQPHNDTVLEFRQHIELARNKLLAHYDRDAVLGGASLGGFPVGDDKKFVRALEALCDVLHKGSFGEILGDMVPSHPGDAIDFKKALARGLAFDKLWNQAKGDELFRLDDLLNEVRAP